MTIESTLERIAAALEAMSRSSVGLAGHGNACAPPPSPPAATPAAEPVKRGPGRPPKAEAPAAPPPETEDSFLDDAPPPAELTLDEVRKALVGYQQRASSAEKARAILKTAGGVDTLKALKPEKYRAVYDAANAA